MGFLAHDDNMPPFPLLQGSTKEVGHLIRFMRVFEHSIEIAKNCLKQARFKGFMQHSSLYTLFRRHIKRLANNDFSVFYNGDHYSYTRVADKLSIY